MAEEKQKKNFDKGFEEEGGGDVHPSVPIESIQFTAEDLYDRDKIDLEQVTLDDVWAALKTSKDGLSADDVAKRTEIFGPNALQTKEQSPFLKFLLFMWNPMSWVMEAAALIAIAVANGQGEPPDWYDFVGIFCLLIINSAIGFYEEESAGNAVKALMESLAPKAKVRRDGAWSEAESSELVPGDVISFKIGDIVPADCRLYESINVSIDQAGLTGESLPVNKHEGDQAFSSTICKGGEAEGVVIATGANSFFGRAATLVGADDDSTGHLQMILARIGSFCMVTIGWFLLAEILVMYAGFRYPYRRGIGNILTILIGGIPIAMPTVLSVTLAVGAQQLAKFKAIVTRITAIEELAGVTILCSDKTGTLTTNKLTIDRETLRTYSDEFDKDSVIRHSGYASRTSNMDAIDTCVVGAAGGPEVAHEGIKVVDFVPFNPTDKRTEVTYEITSSGKLGRVTKGMAGSIMELVSRNTSEELEQKLESDVDEFAARGLRALAVAYEDVPSGNKEDKGNGFELIGLLAIFDPPRDDTKQTIDDAQALGVKVKMVTGDQLAIAKETGRRLGLGDYMFPAKVLKEGGFVADATHASLDDMIVGADGFAGVFPEHKYEIVKRLQGLGHLVAMTGDGANDAPALSKANVGIAVEGATDAARSAGDIVLTEPGLSTIVHAVRQARVIFQRMRNYSMYAAAITVRIVVGFGIMVFGFKFDFPPFMVLIIALLNDGTIMTLSLDRVLPSNTPDHWDLYEIFAYGGAFGLYLSASTIIFYLVMFYSTFFNRKFGVTNFAKLQNYDPSDNLSYYVPVKKSTSTAVIYDGRGYPGGVDRDLTTSEKHNHPEAHMIIYLQVAQISQALIFVTRAQGLWFTERPSIALLCAFAIAQLVSSIIAAYGDWTFTDCASTSGGWIGIVWIWNIVWFFPMDLIKFGMRFLIGRVNKALGRDQPLAVNPDEQPDLNRKPSRMESAYAPSTNFLKRATGGLLGKKVSMSKDQAERVGSRQLAQSASKLQ